MGQLILHAATIKPQQRLSKPSYPPPQKKEQVYYSEKGIFLPGWLGMHVPERCC